MRRVKMTTDVNLKMFDSSKATQLEHKHSYVLQGKVECFTMGLLKITQFTPGGIEIYLADNSKAWKCRLFLNGKTLSRQDANFKLTDRMKRYILKPKQMILELKDGSTIHLSHRVEQTHKENKHWEKILENIKNGNTLPSTSPTCHHDTLPDLPHYDKLQSFLGTDGLVRKPIRNSVSPSVITFNNENVYERLKVTASQQQATRPDEEVGKENEEPAPPPPPHRSPSPIRFPTSSPTSMFRTPPHQKPVVRSRQLSPSTSPITTSTSPMTTSTSPITTSTPSSSSGWLSKESGVKGFYGATNAKTYVRAKPYIPNMASITPSKRKPGLLPTPGSIAAAKRRRFLPSSTATSSISSVSGFSSSRPSLTYRSTISPIKLTGFSNLGNTCYMNAILQSLYGILPFRLDLLHTQTKKEINDKSLYSVICHLYECVRDRNKAKDRDVVMRIDRDKESSLYKIKGAISGRRFSGYTQEDAHEFVCQVLDQINEEFSKTFPSSADEGEGKQIVPLPTSSALVPVDTVVGNPVRNNFTFSLSTLISCTQCEVKRLAPADEHVELLISVPDANDETELSVQDVLDNYLLSEEVECNCDGCSSKMSNTVPKFKTLPRVLILTLKRHRFYRGTQLGRKVNRRILLPRYITLDDHCTEDTKVPSLPDSFIKIRHEVGGSVSGSTSDNQPVPSNDSNDDACKQLQFNVSTEEGNENLGKDDEANVSNLSEEEQLSRALALSLVDSQSAGLRPSEEDEDADLQRALEISRQEAEISFTLEEDKENNTPPASVSCADGKDEEGNEGEVGGTTTSTPAITSNEGKQGGGGAGGGGSGGSASSSSDDELSSVYSLSRSADQVSRLTSNYRCGSIPHSYKLVSIVSHLGSTTSIGHYISDVYDMTNDKWITYDDTHASTRDEATILSQRERTAYILFYMDKRICDRISKS